MARKTNPDVSLVAKLLNTTPDYARKVLRGTAQPTQKQMKHLSGEFGGHLQRLTSTYGLVLGRLDPATIASEIEQTLGVELDITELAKVLYKLKSEY